MRKEEEGRRTRKSLLPSHVWEGKNFLFLCPPSLALSIFLPLFLTAFLSSLCSFFLLLLGGTLKANYTFMEFEHCLNHNAHTFFPSYSSILRRSCTCTDLTVNLKILASLNLPAWRFTRADSAKDELLLQSCSNHDFRVHNVTAPLWVWKSWFHLHHWTLPRKLFKFIRPWLQPIIVKKSIKKEAIQSHKQDFQVSKAKLQSAQCMEKCSASKWDRRRFTRN